MIPSQNFNVHCATMSYQIAGHISTITCCQLRLAVPFLFSGRSIDPKRHLAKLPKTVIYIYMPELSPDCIGVSSGLPPALRPTVWDSSMSLTFTLTAGR
jgi:hypothetical protein